MDARDREKWKVMIAILCQMYNKYEAFNVNEELCCSFMDCLSGIVATSHLLKKTVTDLLGMPRIRYNYYINSVIVPSHVNN